MSINKREVFAKISLMIAIIVIGITYCPVFIVQAADKYLISSTSLLLEPGEKGELSVYEMTGEEYLAPTKEKIIWKSSNKNIATVSGKGIVTAKSQGKATVSGMIGKEKLYCKIIVKKLKTVDLNKNAVITIKGKLETVIANHAGNGEKMTCFVLKLDNPLKFQTDDLKTAVAEIQLVPEDAVQQQEFKEADGKSVIVKGEIISGETAWYIRDFGMINLTLRKLK